MIVPYEAEAREISRNPPNMEHGDVVHVCEGLLLRLVDVLLPLLPIC